VTITQVAGGGAVSAAPPAAEVRGLVKEYGSIRALRGVDLAIGAGEIHGLVGANGAGKSTLIRILAGVEQPDGGEVLVDGAATTIRDPSHATDLGFSFIHQELSLVERFTAAQNIELGSRDVGLLRPASFDGVSPAVRKVADRLGITFRIDIPVARLTVHQKWLVAIAKSMLRRHTLIAMDEPTAALDLNETEHLLGVIKELARDGVAILYVSHRLDEVIGICDRVTVFKDGAVSAEFARGGYARADVVRAIVGAEMDEPEVVPFQPPAGEPLFSAAGVVSRPAVRGVDLTVRAGELVGIAGLVGSGRTELARILFGVDRPTEGEMTLDGVAYRPRNPSEAIAAGVCYVPEERRSEGLFMSRSAEFNLNIATLDRLRTWDWLPLLSRGKSTRQGARLIDALQIKSAHPSTPVHGLSGGNQQKLVIGKWLAAEPRFLVLDEPTRGVDVGAKSEIYARIRDLAASGMGVLVISSEFEELVVCDRVVVMREGRMVGQLTGSRITVEGMLRLCYE
jgi:ABC-type sugar transport system ATPase subunit